MLWVDLVQGNVASTSRLRAMSLLPPAIQRQDVSTYQSCQDVHAEPLAERRQAFKETVLPFCAFSMSTAIATVVPSSFSKLGNGPTWNLGSSS